MRKLQLIFLPVFYFLLAACAANPIADLPPATFAKSARVSYPAQARRDGIQGTVVLRVRVLASGLPGGVEVAKSSGSALLDAAAVEHAQRSEFISARTANGEPVDAWFQTPVRFVLENLGPLRLPSAPIQPGRLTATGAAL